MGRLLVGMVAASVLTYAVGSLPVALACIVGGWALGCLIGLVLVLSAFH